MIVKFETLKGMTIESFNNGTMPAKSDDEIIFNMTNDIRFKMIHLQDCCENVYIEDICGDIEDLIGSEILLAEEVTNKDEHPKGYRKSEWDESFTWTFYKLATIKGYVTIRWLGESNGYYSESVDFSYIPSKKLSNLYHRHYSEKSIPAGRSIEHETLIRKIENNKNEALLNIKNDSKFIRWYCERVLKGK